jgi:carboxyl-terminal processing protease
MRSRAVVVAGILSAALVCGGWFLEVGYRGRAGRGLLDALPFTGSGDGARVFTEVVDRVTRDYVDSVPPDDVYQKAIDGMLQQLHDPHSAFLPADRLRRLTESTTGSYVGLGVQIDIRDGWITIIAAVPGSPAERAGILTGDRLVEIDGRPTHGWTQDEASAALRGAPGTTVRLAVERPGVDTPIRFSAARREIHMRAVRHADLVRPTIGYVDAVIFSDSTARELRGSVDSLRARGMRTLILDLRNDPGGLLAQGVAVADLFLDSGQTVVSMRGRSPGVTRDYTDDARQAWPGLGVILLVNRGTASASEIVAGALQDHDRALILGSPSYGKGSAQTLFHVDDAALKLTTALWYTPSGRSINRRHPRDGADDGSDDDAAGGADSTARADSSAQRHGFHTDAGRVVYGGGGITPDVVVSDSASPLGDAALQRALGTQWPLFRDALTGYALSLKASHTPTPPDPAPTPAMREALWQQMRQRGIHLDRATFDRLSPAVDRWMTTEIERYVFGPEAAFHTRLAMDPVVQAAVAAAHHAESARDLVMHPAAAASASSTGTPAR